VTSPRKPSPFPWIGVVVLALLMGAYVGAYYSTIEPIPIANGNGVVIRVFTGYRHIGPLRFARIFFFPIHAIDRRIRPHVWEPTP
jgi:hypothetical protein